MNITPRDRAGAHKTGSLPSNITPEQIEAVLGFPPNIQDDPDRVTHSWGFEIDGQPCGIWDYKGSRWSTFGPVSLIAHLFNKQPPNGPNNMTGTIPRNDEATADANYRKTRYVLLKGKCDRLAAENAALREPMTLEPKEAELEWFRVENVVLREALLQFLRAEKALDPFNDRGEQAQGEALMASAKTNALAVLANTTPDPLRENADPEALIEIVGLALSNAQRGSGTLTPEEFRNMRDSEGTARVEWLQNTHQARAVIAAIRNAKGGAL